jgi:hypothetical protein
MSPEQEDATRDAAQVVLIANLMLTIKNGDPRRTASGLLALAAVLVDSDVLGRLALAEVMREDRAPSTSADGSALVLGDHSRAASGHYRIAGMPFAASKQWRNFRRSGPATTLFAIASPSYRSHRCPLSSFVAFSATSKFGSP